MLFLAIDSRHVNSTLLLKIRYQKFQPVSRVNKAWQLLLLALYQLLSLLICHAGRYLGNTISGSNPCWLQTSYSLCICHNRCQLQQSNRPVSVAVLFAYTRVVVIMSVCLSVKLSVCLSLSLSRHHPISQALSHDLQFTDPNSALFSLNEVQAICSKVVFKLSKLTCQLHCLLF